MSVSSFDSDSLVTSCSSRFLLSNWSLWLIHWRSNLLLSFGRVWVSHDLAIWKLLLLLHLLLSILLWHSSVHLLRLLDRNELTIGTLHHHLLLRLV